MSDRRGAALPWRRRARSLAVLAAVLWVVVACGSPAMTAAPSAGIGGDPRSSGQGPGLVGDPVFAIGAVVAIGLGAAIVTAAYVRMTNRKGR